MRRSSTAGKTHARPSGVGAPAAVLLAAVAICCCFAAIPHAEAQAFQPATMVDAIDAALFLTQFKQALSSAGLLSTLASPDFNGTVFAPTDLGFTSFLTTQNTTLAALAANNATLFNTMAFHIVPSMKYFPTGTLRQGVKMATQAGPELTVDRSVPGLIHIYGGDMVNDPTNFGTILQYQEIRGGKAVLYVIDKPLLPPAPKVVSTGK
ncbi:FAS1 domain-containing protein [Haematococcus lacustris]